MPINLNEHNFYEERILVSKNLMGLANIQQARSVTGVVQVDKMDNPTGLFIIYSYAKSCCFKHNSFNFGVC